MQSTGPVGLLLESIHLQAATLDDRFRIQQFNQQAIDLVEGPTQLVMPLMTRMAARNRTEAAEGKRQETQGLFEIDTYATNATHWNEVEEGDKLGLRTVQSGVELGQGGHGQNR